MDGRTEKEKRSYNMSRIRGKDTAPELSLRHALHRLGFRYRLHGRALAGRPDLVFPKYHAVVFVHGCFWHRHEGCSKTTTPSSNMEFWLDKFAGTKKRDAAAIGQLQREGWRVAVVWECRLGVSSIGSTSAEVAEWLRTASGYLEIG